MRVRRDPAVRARDQQQGCAAGAAEGLAVSAPPGRVPRHYDAQRLTRSKAVQLVEPERKVPNGGPDVAPLLPLEPLSTCHNSRERAEGDHVLGEQRAGALEVNRSDARLHFDEECTGDLRHTSSGHAAAEATTRHGTVEVSTVNERLAAELTTRLGILPGVTLVCLV